MSESAWDEIHRESDRIIDQALDERRAYESNCTCGAVDIEGGMHLDWCEIETAAESPPPTNPEHDLTEPSSDESENVDD